MIHFITTTLILLSIGAMADTIAPTGTLELIPSTDQKKLELKIDGLQILQVQDGDKVLKRQSDSTFFKVDLSKNKIQVTIRNFVLRPLQFLVGAPHEEPRLIRFFVARQNHRLMVLNSADKVESEKLAASDGLVIFDAKAVVEKKNMETILDQNVMGRVFAVNEKGQPQPVGLLQLAFSGKSVFNLSTNADGTFQGNLPEGKYSIDAVAFTPWFSVKNPSGNLYSWHFADVEVTSTGLDLNLTVPFGQTNTEGLLVYVQAAKAVTKLQGLMGNLTALEKEPMPIIFPGDADYYTAGTVHVTKGIQWDVNTHEMGHALYDRITKGTFGGGQHFIDRCYSTSLALSEGWASYFSAVVHISPDDEDAKFEYMVPRRAPIRIENVPDDVCAGETNEWRVSALFWELYDSHQEAEDALTYPYALTLKGMATNSVSSARAFITILKTMVESKDHQAIEQIWKLNFKGAL